MLALLGAGVYIYLSICFSVSWSLVKQNQPASQPKLWGVFSSVSAAAKRIWRDDIVVEISVLWRHCTQPGERFSPSPLCRRHHIYVV